NAGDVFSSYTEGITSALGTKAISGYGSGLNTVGIYGQSDSQSGLGVKAFNTHKDGTGVAAGGNNIPTIDILSTGSGGTFGGTKTGVYAYATDKDMGTGVIGIGNNTIPPTLPPNGAGGSFVANYMGVFGEAKERNIGFTGAWGGIFKAKGGVWANVGGSNWDGSNWIAHKILGNGVVSTVVKDLNENLVIMFAPEAPEVFFQDYGVGKLKQGKAHIKLDPIFSKNIYIDEKRPLKVFIQLKGDCKGTYVTNETAEGFDVIELQGGTSDAEFNWSVIANRADEIFIEKDGSRYNSSFAKIRFPRCNQELEFKELKLIKVPNQR
nr:hypothetical protein [Bacteroidales bacterium]